MLALAVLGVSNGLLWSVASAPAGHTEIASPVPLVVGPWSGTPLAVDQRAREILETDDVTLVDYRRPAERKPSGEPDGFRPQEPSVWLAQVAGFGTRAAFHPPELCYVGSHYQVLERGPITVMVEGTPYRLMRLVVGQGTDRVEAWYWFTANGRTTPNYYQQQLWLVADAIRGKPVAGTLVRISTPVDDPASAHGRLAHFLASLTRAYATATAS